jgi:hypothetical protein
MSLFVYTGGHVKILNKEREPDCELPRLVAKVDRITE